VCSKLTIVACNILILLVGEGRSTQLGALLLDTTGSPEGEQAMQQHGLYRVDFVSTIRHLFEHYDSGLMMFSRLCFVQQALAEIAGGWAWSGSLPRRPQQMTRPLLHVGEECAKCRILVLVFRAAV
jgi:hypothetical protein